MKSKILSIAALLSMPVLWTACSDSWSEHYSAVEGGMADQPTLLANIADDDNLSNFYRVIQACGAADMLDAQQQMTVWAPLNFTSAQADSVIAVYDADAAAGKEDDDNKAMTQFIQNHIALYARTVSSLTNDTISMLNGKYMQLVGESSVSGTLDDNHFSEMVVCSNGLLYKCDEVMTFYPNIREYTELQSNMDSLTAYLTSYDEYELDESSSVAGGVVDGKTVYLDSVTYLHNDILSAYGYIQREDSTYLFIAPTDEVWATEYDRYAPFFNYCTGYVNNADSLKDAQIKNCILQGRFFNMSGSNKYNQHPTDSITNTQYKNSQTHMPRKNVYYNPYSTILSGLEEVECSNGTVFVDDAGVIDPTTTFFTRKDIEAYSPRYYTLPEENNKETMNSSTGSYEKMIPMNEDGDTIKKYSYVQVKAINSSNTQSAITYTIPETYSNVYYNVYLVTVPTGVTYNGEPISSWFSIYQWKLKESEGTFYDTSGEYWTNPDGLSEDTPNYDVITAKNKVERTFVASAENVDTILIAKAKTFTYSSAGLDDGVISLQVASYGPTQTAYREVVYTRTLRLNELIFVPFETEDEAIEAAYDLDAINDEILATKEN